jgi:hypothetical protein
MRSHLEKKNDGSKKIKMMRRNRMASPIEIGDNEKE